MKCQSSESVEVNSFIVIVFVVETLSISGFGVDESTVTVDGSTEISLTLTGTVSMGGLDHSTIPAKIYWSKDNIWDPQDLESGIFHVWYYL